MNFKKIIIFSLGFIIFFNFLSCVSVSLDYIQPTIDKPNTSVIDSFTAPGRLEDRIRLINRSSNSEMIFKIYVHDPSNNIWLNYGIGTLVRINDTSFISSGLEGKLDKYRYFAIEALDGKKYRYEIEKTRNDLYISILDM